MSSETTTYSDWSPAGETPGLCCEYKLRRAMPFFMVDHLEPPMVEGQLMDYVSMVEGQLMDYVSEASEEAIYAAHAPQGTHP